MASDDENVSTDERVRRSVGRTLLNLLLVVLAVVAGGAWAWYGGVFYQLEPGQAAIVLRLGKHQETVSTPGLKWHWPTPFETYEIVNVAQIAREEFGEGAVEAESPDRASLLEASMQTSDNAIVLLSFVVQYRIKDAFASRFRVAEPVRTLRDAAQAAVREVVGRTDIDGVLSERRGEVEREAASLLQDLLDLYGSGLEVLAIELQEVQPPEPVREAFDDVVAAAQDADRAVNQAEAYRNEVLPRARAEAVELEQSAQAYRDAKIADAKGEAERFTALATEFEKAPEVTQKRLYLETMETVLERVEKVIIEPGTTQVLPYLPISRAREERPRRDDGVAREEKP